MDSALVSYKVDTIFDACPIKGTTSKEKSIYINETRKSNYPTVLTGPPRFPSRPITFSEADAGGIRFPHNDALVITMCIGNCQISQILIGGGSSNNIIYGDILNRMETPEAALAIVCLQTQSSLYKFDEYEAHSPDTISLPVCDDPYNVITGFYVIDVSSPHNVILGQLWSHMTKVVPSNYHQLLWYPTPEGESGYKRRPGYV